MKKNITIITILTFLIISIIIFKLSSTESPFQELNIAGENIPLKHHQNDYNITIDCRNITSNNEQLINYKLIKKYQNSKIAVSSQIYNSRNELIDNYNDLSKIHLEINIENINYQINATCQ